jgi:hypothetical protein
VFECLINPSTRERQELVPSRAYGVKWTASSKAANQFDNAQKSKRENA